MSNELMSCVGLPERPSNIRCANRSCRKVLRVDVGLTSEGLPGAWAKCWPKNGGCGRVTCGMGRHLIATPRDMIWDDGLTDGDGFTVPICQEGLCGRLYEQMERAVVDFKYPRGLQAEMALADMRERAKGGAESWIAICARVMVRVWEYYAYVQPELRRKQQEKQWANPEPVLTYEQFLAQNVPALPANTAPVPTFDELADSILLPEGTDKDMVARLRKHVAKLS